MKNFQQKLELNGKKVTLSANIRNGNLYKRLHDISKKFNVVGGSCPTVQISGYALGGGHGIMSNYYGITAHYLESVKMVTPDGQYVEVSDSSDAQLMWALRGGGHNLGVVTELTFNYESIPEHNWNFIMINNPNIAVENAINVIKAFEGAVSNGAYFLT